MSATRDFFDALRSLVDAPVLVDVQRVSVGDPAQLPEAEREAIARAVPKRVDEFVSGRTLARGLLAELGVAPSVIARGRHGEPLWPSGVVGSISHSEGWVAVAVGRSPDCPGLGVDLESAAALEEELWPTVLTTAEIAALGSVPSNRRGARAKLIFCAKEAAYKAQYPRSGRLMGFEAMTVQLDLAGGSFVARFEADVAPFTVGDTIAGRIAVLEEMVFCVATIG